MGITASSKIKRPAVTYLTNGTFGFRESHLVHDLTILSQEGRLPHVLFYLSNGPGQRRCSSTSDPSLDVRTCAGDFRWRLKHDAHTREWVRRRAKEVLPLINFVHMRGGEVYVVPQLEDNLNKESFLEMANLIKGELPGFVKYGRNACGCEDGADTIVPQGFFEEAHVADPNHFSHHNGTVINDGITYEFPGEQTSYPRKAPLSLLRSARNKAGEMGNWFVLWKASFQGLTGGSLPPPSGRHYVVPNGGQREVLKLFLQGY